jgi:hypothetical protein
MCPSLYVTQSGTKMVNKEPIKYFCGNRGNRGNLGYYGQSGTNTEPPTSKTRRERMDNQLLENQRAESQGKKYRPHIPAVINKIMTDAALRVGMPVKFWLYEAVKEKAEREASEVLPGDSK